MKTTLLNLPDFDKNKKRAFWEMIPYNDEIKRTKTRPIETSPTIANLIKINGQTQIERVSMMSSDTSKIEYLTKTKLKIDGISYLKHKGYDFLK